MVEMLMETKHAGTHSLVCLQATGPKPHEGGAEAYADPINGQVPTCVAVRAPKMNRRPATTRLTQRGRVCQTRRPGSGLRHERPEVSQEPDSRVPAPRSAHCPRADYGVDRYEVRSIWEVVPWYFTFSEEAL